jgi:hypothetical protein
LTWLFPRPGDPALRLDFSAAKKIVVGPLSFATDFSPTFDTNAIGVLNFWAGEGPYDYCISDLKFLDEDGNEVVP